MAKTQNLSLNPTKISGTCAGSCAASSMSRRPTRISSRPARKTSPLWTPWTARGTVVDVNLLKQTVRVRMEDAPDTINTYKNTEIVVLRNGKAKKNDPPIPKDLAPLSSLPKPLKKREPMPEALPEVMFQGESLTAEKPAQPPVQEAAPQRSRRRRRKAPGRAPPRGRSRRKNRPKSPRRQKSRKRPKSRTSRARRRSPVPRAKALLPVRRPTAAVAAVPGAAASPAARRLRPAHNQNTRAAA